MPRVSNGSHWLQQPLTVKFPLGVVSKICALHGRPLFRITAGMYLGRDRRSVCLERELGALPLNYDERGTGTSGRTPGVMDQRFAELKDEGNNSDPENWNNALRMQTGQNINVAAMAVRSCCG